MNNKMAINAYPSTVESKKQPKQTRRTDCFGYVIMDTENILMVAIWKGVWGNGEEVRGLRSTNR